MAMEFFIFNNGTVPEVSDPLPSTQHIKNAIWICTFLVKNNGIYFEAKARARGLHTLSTQFYDKFKNDNI